MSGRVPKGTGKACGRAGEASDELSGRMERSWNETEEELEELGEGVEEILGEYDRLVEDIVYPSIDKAIKKTFGIEVSQVVCRLQIMEKGEIIKEYGPLAVSPEQKVLFVVGAYFDPNEAYILEYFKDGLEKILDFLPEYSGYKVYGIYGGPGLSKEMLDVLKREGLFALVVKGKTVKIVDPRKEGK